MAGRRLAVQSEPVRGLPTRKVRRWPRADEAPRIGNKVGRDFLDAWPAVFNARSVYGPIFRRRGED